MYSYTTYSMFNVYSDSVVREAYIEELGIKTGGCENIKPLKVGEIQSYAGVRPTVDDVKIDVVEHFKYLGTLKSADGN